MDPHREASVSALAHLPWGRPLTPNGVDVMDEWYDVPWYRYDDRGHHLDNDHEYHAYQPRTPRDPSHFRSSTNFLPTKLSGSGISPLPLKAYRSIIQMQTKTYRSIIHMQTIMSGTMTSPRGPPSFTQWYWMRREARNTGQRRHSIYRTSSRSRRP
jgi:hypothetical protein